MQTTIHGNELYQHALDAHAKACSAHETEHPIKLADDATYEAMRTAENALTAVIDAHTAKAVAIAVTAALEGKHPS